MALDVADKVKKQYLDCLYSDEELTAFLLELGYDLITIQEIVVPVELKGTSAHRMKRIHMFNDLDKHTLFITLKEDRTVYNAYYKKGHAEGLYDKEEVSSGNSGCGTLIILLIIVVVAIGGMVLCVNWVSDSNDSDYIIDYRDKDKDGDVDFDDGVKHYIDSLEEDKNDGDDW